MIVKENSGRKKSIINIGTTGTNNRNKSMEKIRGLVECGKCRLCVEQVMCLPASLLHPTPVWVQKASRKKVCQAT